MKRILTTVLAGILLAATPAAACDICGCGVSYYNPYLFPHLSKSYIGLSSIHRTYTTLSHEGDASRERYHTLLLTAQYSLSRKIQLVGMLPWQFNTLQSSTGERHLSGAGDVTLLGQYRPWEHNSDKGIRQAVLVGAGVKLATGRYVPAATNKADDQNFQLGSGSNDLLLNGSYRVSLRKLTFSVSASYKYNNANSDDYRFGDIANVGIQAAWRQEWRRWSLSPYVQVSGDWMLKDADQHVLQTVSGGSVCYAGGGFDVNNRRLAFGASYQFAAAQDLAGGQIRVQPRLSLRTSVTF
ncbi:hypothetical protein EPD60_16380 [Flaviaesturariibacter flavus]|uniref:Transporter n=1 Tax=Flaviaesturariibacter flavus TaxID=2502780 RepID=A0A4R1B6X7_9BACT|nr:hypothetical protein [Flaviaesturariibacter flavus]TCJ12128.1 hypothetical protein EPD60_16380 [Flaviaesturariibacter flavus]